MKSVLNLCLILSLFAQVNTEVFRSKLDSNGFQNKIKTSFHIASGNSDFQTIVLDFYSSYKSDKNRIFLISKYKNGQQNNSQFINNAFVHIRDTYDISHRLDVEAFIQNEFDDFIDLKNRWLFGGYMRFNLFLRVRKLLLT